METFAPIHSAYAVPGSESMFVEGINELKGDFNSNRKK